MRTTMRLLPRATPGKVMVNPLTARKLALSSVSLTRTEKKGRQLKNKLIEQIRDSMHEYAASLVALF